jgi:O-acetyl-ADP-ribose deacetylase (regulator of RNase III)
VGARAQHPGFRAIAVAPAPPDDRHRGAPPRLELALGDITAEEVDAIVTPANQSLLGNTNGVDAAIHRAAGTELLAACLALGGCAVGDAKVTPAFRLSATWIIHAVGPDWQGGHTGETKLLTSVYRRALAVADEVGAVSVAFPSISTCDGGFPLEAAAEIAIDTILATPTHVDIVRFVCDDRPTLECYDQLLG